MDLVICQMPSFGIGQNILLVNCVVLEHVWINIFVKHIVLELVFLHVCRINCFGIGLNIVVFEMCSFRTCLNLNVCQMHSFEISQNLGICLNIDVCQIHSFTLENL